MLSFDSEQCLAFEPVLDEHNDAAIIERLKAIDETWLKMIRFSRTSSPQFFRKLCVRVDAAAADLAAFLSCSTGQRRRDRPPASSREDSCTLQPSLYPLPSVPLP